MPNMLPTGTRVYFVGNSSDLERIYVIVEANHTTGRYRIESHETGWSYNVRPTQIREVEHNANA